MSRRQSVVLWLLLGILAILSLAWLFPRLFPLFPQDWSVSVNEAEDIALDRLRALGELPDDPYVTTVMDNEPLRELRLAELLDERSADELTRSRLGRDLIGWTVMVWERGKTVSEWTYRARVSAAGEVTELRLRVPADEAGADTTAEAARSRADRFLAQQGIDVDAFDEPEVRSRQLENRTDLTFRYRDRAALLGDDSPYGVEVRFAGERLAGFSLFFDDARSEAYQATAQATTLLSQLWMFIALPLLPVLGFFFIRRYHAGEIGVRRGVQIFTVVGLSAAASVLIGATDASGGWNFGVLTRGQVTGVLAVQLIMLFAFPLALTCFFSWSVGESLCRERWGSKLAALDALFKGDWANATVARASLRGLSAGLLIFAGLLILSRLLPGAASVDFLIGPWWESNRWFAFSLLAFAIAYSAYTELFGRLLLLSSLATRFGLWVAVPLAVVIGAVIFFPPLVLYPLRWSLVLWLSAAGAFVFLFLRYGIFTSLLAKITFTVARGALPFLFSADTFQQLQASLALGLVALPFLLSARHLFSRREFVYRYEDVPPHVRRIAERERQRVELETARRIQGSILPELPPQLNGVELAHAYLPATEVGGDFYDVLALEDGRLALAVGDVAGHGVSSGLVMSMARSALSVQVTFDPEVESVFRTMNRMVYQTARKRLLTTLCYALLDPERLELYYGSAGHLFPYRIDREGKVDTLESVAYPLGVRNPLAVNVRTARLQAGDVLFFFSDGVVEARREGSDEQFGFARLEASLRRHAPEGPAGLRDGVLGDIEKFTGSTFREDDQTILALRLPA
ncbi:MAG: PP2C family protein-serine/threonine phosphatase [Acidobacteriota bacterium]